MVEVKRSKYCYRVIYFGGVALSIFPKKSNWRVGSCLFNKGK
jgi:hypothetical protein